MRDAIKRLLLMRRLHGNDWRNFLLRDDFTTAEAAPLTSPRTAEPGPGTLTLVQNDGQFSVSGGKLVFPAQTTPVAGDQGFYGAAQTRDAGLTLLCTLNYSADGVTGIVPLAWKTVASADGGTNRDNGFYINGSSTLGALVGTISVNVGTLAINTDYFLAIVLRASGAFYFIKGGAFTNWTLLWVDAGRTTATLYPALGNYDAVGTLDSFRVLDLPAPFATDYGLATQRLAGARTAGDTFSHTANCVIEYVLTTLPASGATQVYFRYQDVNNYWSSYIAADGSFTLYEVVAGVATSRGSLGSGIANGHRIVIVCDGTTIRGYSNNVLRWTYSSASNFATSTAGRVALLGVSGAISDAVSWPRTLTGAAAALLDASVA